MDEVLCDFLKSADHLCTKRGLPNFQSKAWNCPRGDQSAKWAPIIEDPNFWQDLEFREDGKLLWDMIKAYRPSLLSAYTKYDKERAILGKNAWINAHLSRNDISDINIVHRNQKKNFAINKDTGKPNILIDDYYKNIEEFEAAGGIGIVHKNAENTIKRLEGLGFELYYDRRQLRVFK